MKIKLSKSQWEEMGKKAGWKKEAQGRMDRGQEEMYPTTGKPFNKDNEMKQLTDIIQQITKIQDDFRNVSANIPKDKWILIERDCDAVVQSLDNAAGRISTIIQRTK
jgi:hypothetical protein